MSQEGCLHFHLVLSGRPPRSEASSEPPVPMVINFQKLKPAPSPADTLADSEPANAAVPIPIRSPNVLKIVLLQASEAAGSSVESTPMDLISLSGVALHNVKGEWELLEGANFHDPLPLDCCDHTETFPLPGGIRAIYNHTHRRWHVLPPPPPISQPSERRDESSSLVSTSRPAEEVDHGGGRCVCVCVRVCVCAFLCVRMCAHGCMFV